MGDLSWSTAPETVKNTSCCSPLFSSSPSTAQSVRAHSLCQAHCQKTNALLERPGREAAEHLPGQAQPHCFWKAFWPSCLYRISVWRSSTFLPTTETERWCSYRIKWSCTFPSFKIASELSSVSSQHSPFRRVPDRNCTVSLCRILVFMNYH